MKKSTSMPNMTNQRFLMLEFIKAFVAAQGYAPTIREIGAGMNLSSSSTIFAHVKALEQLGHLVKTARKSRSLHLACSTTVTLTGVPCFEDPSGVIGLRLANGVTVYLAVEYGSALWAECSEAYLDHYARVTITSSLVPKPKDKFEFARFVQANDAELRAHYKCDSVACK